MNAITSIHFEWNYSPENFFRNSLSVPFDAGTIEISNGIVTAKIDPTILQVDQLPSDESDNQNDKIAEKLDEQIDTLVEKIDDQIEKLFHSEQKKTQISYKLGLPFKIVVRNDGSELVAPA